MFGGEGPKRATEPQWSRKSFLATTDSRIRKQYHAAFRPLNCTRRSEKPAFYLDSELPSGASSEVPWQEGSTLAVGGGKVRGGSSSVRREGGEEVRATETARRRGIFPWYDR